jgi:hypothetical protein
MIAEPHVPVCLRGAHAARLRHRPVASHTKGEWERNWALTVADAAGERRIPVRVTLFAPGMAAVDQPAATLPLESSDWQCWLPEVGLLCKRGRSKKDKEFSTLKALTDAEQSRKLLEQALRAQALAGCVDPLRRPGVGQ